MHLDYIKYLSYMGMHIDGEHHKQWFLVEIAKEVGINVEDELDEENMGIAPSGI